MSEIKPDDKFLINRDGVDYKATVDQFAKDINIHVECCSGDGGAGDVDLSLYAKLDGQGAELEGYSRISVQSGNAITNSGITTNNVDSGRAKIGTIETSSIYPTSDNARISGFKTIAAHDFQAYERFYAIKTDEDNLQLPDPLPDGYIDSGQVPGDAVQVKPGNIVLASERGFAYYPSSNAPIYGNRSLATYSSAGIIIEGSWDEDVNRNPFHVYIGPNIFETSNEITAAGFIGDGSKLTNLPTADVDLSEYAKLDGEGQEIINTAKFQCQNKSSYHDNMIVAAPFGEFIDTLKATKIKGPSSDYVSTIGVINLEVDQNLVLNDVPIQGASTITAQEFVGDGSKLTNLPTADVDLSEYAKLTDPEQVVTSKQYISDTVNINYSDTKLTSSKMQAAFSQAEQVTVGQNIIFADAQEFGGHNWGTEKCNISSERLVYYTNSTDADGGKSSINIDGVQGSITANKFIGDGSDLTNVMPLDLSKLPALT